MCGVGAVFSNRPIKNLNQLLNETISAIKHRGPDGNGIWISEGLNAGLCHTRLSIIDVTESSSQPMKSHDDRYVISFNGEIYNYVELREKCISLGSVFKSHGDTEVIIEMYRHFKSDINQYLRGMWAFLIIDTIEDSIFISRDPFGIKPLFYGEKNGSLYFASELKAFHKIDASFIEVDELSVRLFKEEKIYDRGNWTFFKNIKRFPHACSLKFSLKKVPEFSAIKFDRYWNPFNTKLNHDSPELIKETVKKLFLNSMKLHMRSDVPIGFCLSGGIDSSAIVASAKECYPDSKLKTFTTRFPDYKHIDETKWAELVIKHVNAQATFVEPKASEFKDEITKLVEVQDEPFSSASIYSQYCIFRKIGEEKVKVVLDGQGADEVFSGYHAFFPFYLRDLLKQKKFILYFQTIFILRKKLNFQYPLIKPFLSFLYRSAKNGFRAIQHPQLNLDYALVGEADNYEQRLSFIRQEPQNFEEFLIHMVCEGNVPMLLRFEDRNSMAFSVESRVPFLINELVEYSLSIPAKFKLQKGITKSVFRESMRGIVPDKVLGRLDKLGFPAPDKEWLKEIYGNDVKGSYSEEWIALILNTWKDVLSKRKQESLNLL